MVAFSSLTFARVTFDTLTPTGTEYLCAALLGRSDAKFALPRDGQATASVLDQVCALRLDELVPCRRPLPLRHPRMHKYLEQSIGMLRDQHAYTELIELYEGLTRASAGHDDPFVSTRLVRARFP